MDILLVEDNPLVQRLVTHALSRQGYRVKVAGTYWGARRDLERLCIDLAILDIELPDGNGLDLARWVRSRPATRGMPLLFLTALNCPRVLCEAMELGSAEFLAKPLRPELLRKTVEHLIWVGNEDHSIYPVEAVGAPPLPLATAAPVDAPDDGEEPIEFHDWVGRLIACFLPGSRDLLGAVAEAGDPIGNCADVLRREPEMSAAVLTRLGEISDRRHFGRPSLATACALLGRRELCSICLRPPRLAVDGQEFGPAAWCHGIQAGYLAGRLAEVLCAEQSRQVKLASLLHLCAIPAQLTAEPDRYRTVIERVRHGADWAHAERTRLGVDHPTLGAALASELGFDQDVAELIETCEDPNRATGAPAWCVAVASCLVQQDHDGFPRRSYPGTDLRVLARNHPRRWHSIAPFLSTFRGEVEEHAEILHS